MQTNRQSSQSQLHELSTEVLLEALAPAVDPLGDDEAGAILEEARSGNAAAQYIVGVALECAEPPRLPEARDWLCRAAEQHYAPAERKLRELRPQ